MLVFSIQRVEKREENIVLVKSKKNKEGRKNFFYKTKKQRGSSKMLCEVDSLTAENSRSHGLWNFCLEVLMSAQLGG